MGGREAGCRGGRNRLFFLAEGLEILRRGKEVGRDLSTRHDVVDGHLRGQALRVGDQPLLQLQLRSVVEDELDAARGVAAIVLERDGERPFLAFDPDDAGIAAKIDSVGQQQAERRRLDGIFLDRLQVGIFDGEESAVGDDAKPARRRVVEPDLAGPLHVEASRGVLVGRNRPARNCLADW